MGGLARALGRRHAGSSTRPIFSEQSIYRGSAETAFQSGRAVHGVADADTLTYQVTIDESVPRFTRPVDHRVPRDERALGALYEYGVPRGQLRACSKPPLRIPIRGSRPEADAAKKGSKLVPWGARPLGRSGPPDDRASVTGRGRAV